jgi:hypothetical protein
MFSVTALDRSFSNRIASLRKLPQHFIAAEKQCFHTVCKKNATAESLSKTRVFERVCRTGKVTGRSGLNLS